MKKFFFPSEETMHEGTWLNWPHHYTYGIEHREEIEPIWIAMTSALHKGENVHIVVYNDFELIRVTELLKNAGINMTHIDLVIAESDDVWSRDTGPLFVLDEGGKLAIANFAFDGWGRKASYEKDNNIPQEIARAKSIPLIELPDFVLEGGSVELDGHGTAMLCKSSVVSKNRNSHKSIKDAEKYLAQYFGVSNFIWLEGVLDEDITDGHIDGTARFYGENTILTVSEDDFFELYKGAKREDYLTLCSAKNARGVPYRIVEFPLTVGVVEKAGIKGCYLNYYVGNEVVLLPAYLDENDARAIQIMSELYPDKEIVPIDVRALYQYGGMLHCVTQQQPKS